MRIADMLHAMAAWLESPNNEALLLAEYDSDCLKVVAQSCVSAAIALKQAADQVADLEPPAESAITPESIAELAQIATAFDASGDPNLRKQASVIDELLLTIAAPPNALASRKDLEDGRLEELKKKYENPRKNLKEINKMSDVDKVLDKSRFTKEYKILEAPLSTRYCPDHPGAQIARVGEHVWQCDLDKKVYNFETGFDLNNGSKVPGGDVSLQTSSISVPYQALFDTREGRLGTNKP